MRLNLNDADGFNAHACALRAPIPFHRTAISHDAASATARVLLSGAVSAGGDAAAECDELLRQAVPSGRPFLTHSCTGALELAALVLELGPGDEVIMPSWTFPSTANAVALRGAVPVFVDVCAQTLNIDVERARAAVTARTRALVCVHYAGVACDMAALTALCQDHGLALVEDAAQALGARWRGRPLGSFGAMSAFSFHGTKNVSSGEGGALIVNQTDLAEAAERAWEKGTDRARFERGEVDRYEWCSLGSSFQPSALTAAFLAAQLRRTTDFTARRLLAWRRYAQMLRSDVDPCLRTPRPPRDAEHNGHIFAVHVPAEVRAQLIAYMYAAGVDARFHYSPLHLSTAGRRYARAVGPLDVTEAAARTLLRLPLDSYITADEQAHVVATLKSGLAALA